jgi:hypothetical protein
MNTEITVSRMVAMIYNKIEDGRLDIRIMYRGWGLDADRKSIDITMVGEVTVYGDPTVAGCGHAGEGRLHGSDEDVAVLRDYVAPQNLGSISSDGGEVAFNVKDHPGDGLYYGSYTAVRMNDAATGAALLRALT